jgi:predicted DNA-binding protein
MNKANLDNPTAGIPLLPVEDYHWIMAMKGITIKLPEETLKRLAAEARASGRSVAAIIRERVESPPESAESVYGLTRDLAGRLSGTNAPASNARRKFARS